MRAPVPGTAALAVLGILYWTAHTMLRPLVGPYVLEEGGSAGDASFALASFAILPTLLAIPIGSMTDRWGARRLLAGGATMMVLGGGLMFAPWGLSAVIISQALIGLGTIAYWVALQSVAMVSRTESRDQRNARIATFSLFLAAGQSVGPALGGGLEAAGGYQLAFWSFIGVAAALLVITLLVLPKAPAESRSGPGTTVARPSIIRSYGEALSLLKSPTIRVTVAVSFTGLVILDIRMAYQPVLFSEAGVQQWEIGLLLSIAAVAGFFARPFFAPGMRVLGGPLMVGLVLGVGVISVAAVVIAPDNMTLLICLSAVNGFALGFAQPLTLSLMADETPLGKEGLAASLRSFANRGAQFANPALFGTVTAAVGLSGAFLVVGVIAVGATGLSVQALRRSRGPG